MDELKSIKANIEGYLEGSTLTCGEILKVTKEVGKLKKYFEKKAAGEKHIRLEPEKLD